MTKEKIQNDEQKLITMKTTQNDEIQFKMMKDSK